jgi:hypothetical protein
MNDQMPVRVSHALQTMSTLLRALFRKKFTNFSTDILTLLTGLDLAEQHFQV